MIEKYCSLVIKDFGAKTTIPGILVIDTPGHEVFSNLRARGGSVSDIAVLVIDVLQGVEKQTAESIEILRSRKTPFIVAANKIDKVAGWVPHPEKPVVESYRMQSPQVQERADQMIYRIVGDLGRYGFSSDRYDRIRDFTKAVAIVPTSAVTGEGIPELLALLCGLVQQYLTKRLAVTEGPGKGVVLETKEEPGLGNTIDVILYDGILNKGDRVVVGGFGNPIVTKVRALLLPKPLNEIRDPEDKFQSVETAVAAAGVKIVATGLEGAVSGAPVIVAADDAAVEAAEKRIREEMSELRFTSDAVGVIVKADTLGSLEALIKFLKDSGIPVRISDVGPIGRHDLIEATLVKRQKPEFAAIVGFNVKAPQEVEADAKARGIPLFTSNVIYHIVDDFRAWSSRTVEEMRRKELGQLVLPGEFRILPGCVFRKNSPPIFGVEVLVGTIKPGYTIMKANGEALGTIMQIQDSGKTVQAAKKGEQVAVSVKGDFTVGRQVQEGETLLVQIPDNDAYLLREKYKGELSEEELAAIERIQRIRWKDLP